ncbi:MAG: D-hexose-6-phosphate mutarotase [Herpetosiphon sp.]
MLSNELATLNAHYAIPDHVEFVAGPGGLPIAALQNGFATAQLSLQGAQLLSFQPRGHQPVLFASSAAIYAPGRAIRGGIPVCWPWFGPHPTDGTKPQHGFVRTMRWLVRSTEVTGGGGTRLQLALVDSAETRKLWPHPFELILTATVDTTLHVDLVARNTAPDPVLLTAALHTYLAVSNVAEIIIDGLQGRRYIDKVSGTERTQDGPVTIASETDCIYLDVAPTCVIHDPTHGRAIHIMGQGSRSTVVWNPWQTAARRIADLGDAEYQRMVCVETANAGTDVVTVPPGGEHRLVTHITVEHQMPEGPATEA